MCYTFDSPDAPTTRSTQYYEMLGTRGIWHNGWKAVTRHGPTSGKGDFMNDEWELYHTDVDRSESHDLAAEYPGKLQELIALWWVEAGKNNVLPLDDRRPVEILSDVRPKLTGERNSYTYYPNCAEVPEAAAVSIRNRSFNILADVEIDTADTEGVIFAQGSRFGGHSLFIKNGKLYYVYNFVGLKEQKFVSNENVPEGRVTLGVEFTKEKEEPKGVARGTFRMYINDKVVSDGKMATQPGHFTLAGEGLCVARDSGDAVSDEYKAPFKFTGGKVLDVIVNVSGERFADLEKEAHAMFARE